MFIHVLAGNLVVGSHALYQAVARRAVSLRASFVGGLLAISRRRGRSRGRRPAWKGAGRLYESHPHDVTRCTGCEQCVQACVEANGLAGRAARRAIKCRTVSPEGSCCSVVAVSGDGAFARKSCLSLPASPPCVEACLVGAITKTADGPVVYDADKCIGCRYCMLACPFGIPRYEWEKTMPFIRKCTMCSDRAGGGQAPGLCRGLSA